MSEIYHITRSLSRDLCEKYHTFLFLKNSAGGPRMAAGLGEYSLPASLLSMRGSARPGGRALQVSRPKDGRPHGADPTDLIRLASLGTFLQGKACGRVRAPAPTAETRPGALVRQSQAQKLNHSSGNFPHIQGPVARQEFRPVTQILRAGNSAQPYWYASPVTVSGERRLCARSAHSEPSPAAFWLISPVLPAKSSVAGSPGRGGARERSQFSPSGGNGDKRTLRRRAAAGKVTRRPQAAKSPGKEETTPSHIPRPVHIG